MIDIKAMGDRIQRGRKKQGLTQEQLAAIVGESAAVVALWEQGEKAPDIHIVPALCTALQTTADLLLGTVTSSGRGVEPTKRRAPELRAMKLRGEKIVMLTAYDYPAARLVDRFVDVILVGDSVGSNVLGYSSEVPVTLDVMLHHTKAVCRATRRALVVADLPFMTYSSVEQGLDTAKRLVQEGGADAVKFEGAGYRCELVRQLVDCGIPVMGHLGLLPQSINQLGGLRVQARSKQAIDKLVTDALELEKSGAFAIVLELMPREAAQAVTAALSVPTIGIGAGPDCDGQVLILYDMLGWNEFHLKMAKRYAEISGVIAQAVSEYAQDVRSGRFPDDSNSFHMPK